MAGKSVRSASHWAQDLVEEPSSSTYLNLIVHDAARPALSGRAPDAVRSIRELLHSLDLIATEGSMLRIVHGCPAAVVSHVLECLRHRPVPASLPKLSLKRCAVRMERVIAVVCDARGVYPGLPTTTYRLASRKAGRSVV
jgi:hypothetical protein